MTPTRTSRSFRLAVLLCSLGIAGLAAWAADEYCVRKGKHPPWLPVDHRDDFCLNGIAGLEVVLPHCEPGPEFADNPEFLAVYQRICERARAYLREPSVRHDIWVGPPESLKLHGWPFESRGIVVYCCVLGGEVESWVDFYADEHGENPIRYWGWIGNIVVYFVVALPLAWGGATAVGRTWRWGELWLAENYSRLPRPSPRTILILTAVLMASSATYTAHRWIERPFPKGGFLGGWGGTVYLCHNVKCDEPWNTTGIDAIEWQLPGVTPFVTKVSERSRAFLKPNCRYDVWMIAPKARPRGWPFESRATAALVAVDEYPAGRESVQYVFWADESGSSPMRYGGLVANWSLYFVASGVFAWLGDMVVRMIIRRRRRVRHGFPVEPVERESA